MSEPETIAIAELAEVNPKVDLRRLRDDTPVSFIPMSDVTQSGQWVNHQERQLDARFGYTPFAEGDVLFAKITPCMENGKGAHAVGLKNGVGFGSTEFHVLRACGETSARYLFHWLQAQRTRTRAIAYMGGSAGQQRVQSDFFTNFRVHKLKAAEQSRIAAVLDMVDEAISKTEAVIAKLRQVRAGLLHDLLTRGLDKNGQLRDPIAHPEQFQDSPLGQIPKEWEVVPLKVKCETYAGGTPSRSSPEFFGGAIPWVKSGEVNQETITETEESLTTEGLASSNAKWISEGTPLIAMYGATAGQVSWLAIRATANQAVLAIVPRSAETVARFIFWAVRYSAQRVVVLATGSGQPNLSKGMIEGMLLALPTDAAEQNAITERIDGVIASERSENSYLGKLVHLKSGLMTDLLTGRVSVTENLGTTS